MGSLGLGNKKESTFGKSINGSFGKKPNNGSFGKKPNNGSFGKTSADSFSKKQSTLKPKRKNTTKKSSIKSKPTKNKRYELVLTKYMKWLHREYPGLDVHHWIPRSKIGRNDFFVVMLDHDYHISVVHGDISPSGYVELVGRDELIFSSCKLFIEWLKSDLCDDFHRGFLIPMIHAIKEDSENAEQITKNFSLELYYNNNPS